MEFKKLGQTDIEVSLICLGTMTWGEQNTEEEAWSQLDYAIENKVNFIDCAEMYPIPPSKDTQGRTETYIGRWLKERGNRDQVIVATKVAGQAEWLPYIRNGKNRLDRTNIEKACHDSLKRLQTDYIDLYQTHWPDRATNFFGRLGYQKREDNNPADIEETVDALADLVKAGKIRSFGVSNETPWGVAQYLSCAEKKGLPQVASIQNPYNLLNRSFEVGLAEFSHRQQVGLLAYSPLAFGVLSGKYIGGQKPKRARLTLFKNYSRYSNPQALAATEAYIDLAKKHQLDPSQMALAYINSRFFVTSNIIGATNLDQLKTNINSVHVKLSDEVLEGIEAIHKKYTYPSP